MAELDEYNMIRILNDNLEEAIKNRVIEDIITQQLIDLEEKIRPMIKEEVEKLTFKGIDAVHDMMSIQRDFQLYIKWSDEQKTHKMYKVRETVETEEVDR